MIGYVVHFDYLCGLKKMEMKKNRIVLVGSGNVATHLGRGLAHACELVQVFSRTLAHARELARELGVPLAASQPADLVPDADVYLLAVSDDAIDTVVQSLPDNGALWLHTAGSVGLDVLSRQRRRCGVLYPMQSFTRTLPVDWSQVPIFVEGCDAATTAQVRDLASLLSQHVQQCDSQQRMALHIAAVFSCNFTNLLWTQAHELLNHFGLDFDAMLPLIATTVGKLDQLSPRDAQTGPARRGDVKVLQKHLALLDGDKRATYQLLSQAIMQRFHTSPTRPVAEPDFKHIRGIAFDVDGVLSPSTIPMHPSGEPMRMVNIKDGYAIQLAVKLGFPLAIISGANVEAVRVRFEGLGMKDVFLGATHKLPVFRQWMDAHGLQRDEVIFVGDDIPDLPVMREAGMAVAPADACREVLEAAHYVTPCRGGDGVARHLIQRLLTAHGLWLNDEHAFGW